MIWRERESGVPEAVICESNGGGCGVVMEGGGERKRVPRCFDMGKRKEMTEERVFRCGNLTTSKNMDEMPTNKF